MSSRYNLLQVYILSYRESVEVAKFQQAASREKQSFLSLVQKKGHMVLPVDEVGLLPADTSHMLTHKHVDTVEAMSNFVVLLFHKVACISIIAQIV
jgi:hypothetical protein